MENERRSSKSLSNKADRRRGRPAGKNRVPLSLEERRARNAQYERERRNETALAMAQLAEAAGCDANIANAELLATVINQLQRRQNRKQPKHTIEDLERINNNLESQIVLLESRLTDEVGYNPEELEESDSDSSSETELDSYSTELQKPCKLRKIHKKNSIIDQRNQSKKRRTKNQSTSSTDSQDSANRFATNPDQEELKSTDYEESIRPQMYEPQSSKWTSSASNFKSDMVKGDSTECTENQSVKHQEVTLDFQLVPEQMLNSNHHHDLINSEMIKQETLPVESFDVGNFGCQDSFYLKNELNELSVSWSLSDYEDLTSCQL